MVRHTRKRKHGGMQANPAAAGAGNPLVNENALADQFGQMDIGRDLPDDDIEMDMEEHEQQVINYDMEVDAFGAVEANVGAADNSILVCLPLNVELPDEPRFTQEALMDLIRKVDFIHCKAFNSGSGIVVQEARRLSYNPPPTIYPEDHAVIETRLCMLCEVPAADAAPIGNTIILVCVVNIHGSDEFQMVDIWSVAKNPNVRYPNAFRRFINAYKEVNANARTFYLTVGTDNTVTITEQARLRLYTSLGFRLLNNQAVNLIYPRSADLFITNHNPDNRGEVILSAGAVAAAAMAGQAGIMQAAAAAQLAAAQRAQYCSYIGNIQSSSVGGVKIPIKMVAQRAEAGGDYNITLDFPPLNDETAFLYTGANRQAIRAVPGILTDNESIDIPVPAGELTYIKGLYHMGLANFRSRRYPGNTFIQSINVPDDFLIFTITSPGSFLYGNALDIENFMSNTVNELQGAGRFQQFIQNNKSTQKLPITNLHDETSYRMTLIIPATTAAICDTQINKGFLSSKLLEQLGRQPIFQFPLPPGPAAAPNRFQLDFQLYGPGMKIFNYEMMRGDNPSDNADRLGTYLYNHAVDPPTFTHNANDVAFTDNRSNLRNYFDFIRAQYPAAAAAAPRRYFLFMFGCSGLPRANNQYELLYELSHRRLKLLPHVVEPPIVSYQDIRFIREAVFNKKRYQEYNCAAFGDGADLRIMLGGGKRRRKQTRKQSKRKTQRRKTRKQ
jgi:hypothetical protein